MVAVVVVPSLVVVVYNNFELVWIVGWMRGAGNVLGRFGVGFSMGMGAGVHIRSNRPSGRLASRKPALVQVRVTPLEGRLVSVACGVSSMPDV